MRVFFVAGAVFAGLAVALGAFGAHALRDVLSAAALENWHTAVRYQLAHALALLLLSVAAGDGPRPRAACWCLSVGIVLFSGSLYGLSAGLSWLWPATPTGGLLLLAGWALSGVWGLRRWRPGAD